MTAKPKPRQVDYDGAGRNMFGLLPCPGCGGEHRYPTQPVHPTHPRCVLCDQCGRAEPIEHTEGATCPES